MSRGDKGRRGSPQRAADKRPTELKIKLEYGSQIRRFGVRSFAELQSQTCELYQLTGTAFNLKYQDEADLVTVSNDKDLEECRRVQNSDTLRLSVFPIPSLSSRNHYSRSPPRNRSASPLRSRSESPLDSRARSRSRSPLLSRSRSRSASRSPSQTLYASPSSARSRSPSAEFVARELPKDRRDSIALELWEDLNWASLRELPRDTQNHMRKIVNGGRVTMKDFSPTIIPSLAQLPRGVQAQVLDRFGAADLSDVRSVSGFFISLLKQARAQVKADNERRDPPNKRPRTTANDDRTMHKRRDDQAAKQSRGEEQKRDAARKEAARFKKEKEEREIQRKEQAREQRKKEQKEVQRRQEEQKREEKRREQERRERERRDEERREADRRDAERREDEKRAKEKREEQERRARTDREQRRPPADRDERRRPAKRHAPQKSPVRDDSPPRARSPVAIPVTRRIVEMSPSRSRSPSREPTEHNSGDGDGQDGVRKPRLLVKKRSGIEQEFRQSPESRHELTVVKKSHKLHFHTVQKAQPAYYKKTFTDEPPPVFMCRNHHKPRTLQHLHPLTTVPGEYVCKYGHECTNVN